jgi:tetratricopeptide (TPR) repeat protein
MKMKIQLKQIAFTGIIFAMAVSSAFAQCKGGWPEDKKTAEEKVAVFSDAVRQGSAAFDDLKVREAIRWMIANAPKWNTKLYVDAATVYDGLATKETDPTKKKIFVDSLMIIYDLRLQNCGDEVNVLNRKAGANVKHNINNKEKAKELLAQFDRVYEISGNIVNDNNLEAYMSVIYVNFIAFKGSLTDEQILSRYDKLSAVIDAKIAKAQTENKAGDVEKYKKIKANVDDKLIKMVKVDCKFVKANLEPKFKANPKDVALAKKIFKFMLEDNCADDPLWLEAAMAIHEVEKDCGLAKNLGKRLIGTDLAKAETFFKEAQNLCTSPEDKSDVLVLLGAVEVKKSNPRGARELFRQSLTANPNNKDAYEKIGDLYMNAGDDCAKRVSKAEDRLVYLAAYDMYAKAGNQTKMNHARAQFPSVTELFEMNWKDGEKKTISNCWVGETVTLRTRGKE